MSSFFQQVSKWWILYHYSATFFFSVVSSTVDLVSLLEPVFPRIVHYNSISKRPGDIKLSRGPLQRDATGKKRSNWTVTKTNVNHLLLFLRSLRKCSLQLRPKAPCANLAYGTGRPGWKRDIPLRIIVLTAKPPLPKSQEKKTPTSSSRNFYDARGVEKETKKLNRNWVRSVKRICRTIGRSPAHRWEMQQV